MRILVLSDSHRICANMNIIFESLSTELDAVIHLGDNTEDLTAFRKIYKHLDFHTVSGNCDYGSKDTQEKCILLSGKRLYFTHGHSQNVKSGLQRIVYTAWEKEADICLFGHTHASQLFTEGTTAFMNPGSVSLPRDGGDASYGIINLTYKQSFISVMSIKGHDFKIKYSLPL